MLRYLLKFAKVMKTQGKGGTSHWPEDMEKEKKFSEVCVIVAPQSPIPPEMDIQKNKDLIIAPIIRLLHWRNVTEFETPYLFSNNYFFVYFIIGIKLSVFVAFMHLF